jgi:hypothetical protein
MCLAQVFAMEWNVAMHFMVSHDFYEGVRALIIDKDNHPKWDPQEILRVPTAMVHSYFTKFSES